MDKGVLYIVSLPLGNLEDITLRALRTLSEVDAILAEDTREIAKFLTLKSLPRKKLISYRDQNHDRVVKEIAERIEQGENLALVSDRGTPTISDPGYKLVRDLTSLGITVVTIPGPVAAMAALSISGLPTDRFVFLGFLPRSRGKQRKILGEFATLPATFIIYESPFRIVSLLRVIAELGNVDVALARELTKMNEEVIRGKVLDVIDLLKDKKLKGEWVVMGHKASV